eukprot:4817533-Pyramimonas_sp.AAC.1
MPLGKSFLVTVNILLPLAMRAEVKGEVGHEVLDIVDQGHHAAEDVDGFRLHPGGRLRSRDCGCLS